jgi:hypothetical protein
MITSDIGRLERVPLRHVWENEAKNFTHWLEKNTDLLGEVISVEFSDVEREQSAGNFNVDLIAKDLEGNTIVIENQLEKSDHDHLGKIITYAAALDAKMAIWVVSAPRPEHVAAITWLNESSTTQFFMVKIEAVKIGTSDPAALFTLITGPSDEIEDIQKTKKDIADRYEIRKKWWTYLISHCKKLDALHKHLSPGSYSWMGTTSGIRGLIFKYTVTQHESGVEFYIDRGANSESENLDVYNAILGEKDSIENTFKSPLRWDILEGKRACRISYVLNGGYRRDESEWDDIQILTIKTMSRLEAALRPSLLTLGIKT